MIWIRFPQVSSRDGHDHGAEVGRRLGEFGAGGALPRVLGMDIVDGELCSWDPVGGEAQRNILLAGCAAGSRSSSVPSAAPGRPR